jgi:membrane-associated phospholipid phosphatase
LKTKHSTGLVFSVGYVVLFSFLFVITLVFTKEEIHIFTNQQNSLFMDELMRYWTYLGDGVVLLFIIVLSILISVRHSFIFLGSYLSSGLLAQFLKRFVFTEMPRPTKFFDLQQIDYQLYLVPDVHQLGWHSFPSGHTAAAFAIFFAMALMTKSKLVQITSFLLALGVAYSRIYLSQHFLMDVVAGSAIGMVSAWLIFFWIKRYQASWLDKPVLKLKRK